MYTTHKIYITPTTYVTHMLKLIFKAYKKIRFFFLYAKMLNIIKNIKKGLRCKQFFSITDSVFIKKLVYIPFALVIVVFGVVLSNAICDSVPFTPLYVAHIINE